MAIHTQVPTVFHSHQGALAGVEVDAGLVTLVEALFILEYETQFSCQGVRGDEEAEAHVFGDGERISAYVSFASSQDGYKLASELMGLDLPFRLEVSGPTRRYPYMRSVIRFDPDLIKVVTTHLQGLVADI